MKHEFYAQCIFLVPVILTDFKITVFKVVCMLSLLVREMTSPSAPDCLWSHASCCVVVIKDPP